MEKGIIQRFIEWIIEYGGLYVLLLVVFAETGLFIGFFFPGDSLLFAAGIYVDDLAKEFFNTHWSVIMLMVIIASVLGNMVGYWFGYKSFSKKRIPGFLNESTWSAQNIFMTNMDEERFSWPNFFLLSELLLQSLQVL